MTTTSSAPKATGVTVDASALQELRGIAAAVDRSQAVIEFDLDGRVLAANDAFLALMGYALPELVGKHHRIFCEPAYTASEEYTAFWERLRAGEVEAAEYKRYAKGGREVWIQATYNPILDAAGTPVKVVKFATDVTAEKTLSAETASLMAAVDRAQAVVEFDLSGHVLRANDNFLQTMGYALEDVLGQHHRMFCLPDYATTDEYLSFWKLLRSGELKGGEYRRVAKGGREVWLQASYNPVLGADGQPYKIVKFATDVTVEKRRAAETAGTMAAVHRAQAVIEFDLTGHVLAANENFLALMGYSAAEVVGKHHHVFCDPAYTATDAYEDFWERLRSGAFEAGEFRRLAKGGSEVWIRATYNPILDEAGRPFKVVKFATDVTAEKLTGAEVSGKVDAIDRAQAVIEFDLDGMVTAANDNFLAAMGYQLREIVGQHHSTFCSPEYRVSEEYRDFWLRLGKGEFISGRFHRVGKFGRDVHIQATYNPILDLSGEPFKVVKYAHDVTAEVAREQRIARDTKMMTDVVADLSASIGDIATSSGVASDLASETHRNAQEGVRALRASLEAIALIQKSSRSISEIVQVMGEIANQTNLLAFNASIEAARAGEHGVGFSIVAGEVRKLAERSFEAAQQIGALISESVERVEQGSEVSAQAEGAFGRIVSSVERTNEAISSISASTKVQQSSYDQVQELALQLASSDAQG